MKNNPPVVLVVDDVAMVAEVTAMSLAASGEWACRWYTDPDLLLSELVPGTVDCVVADLLMPQMTGAELQERLLLTDSDVSFVFLSGWADVPSTVRVMERGAVTLIEKPPDPERLFSAVREGVARTERKRSATRHQHRVSSLLHDLNEDERTVLRCLLEGSTTKFIARQLATSCRTIDRRRSAIFRKCGVVSVAELASLFVGTFDQVDASTILFKRNAL